MRLDYVLALKVEDFMERRLQTQVFKSGLAKSIHHARVLIRQRHIRVGKQIVNVPSFVVRLDSQKVCIAAKIASATSFLFLCLFI